MKNELNYKKTLRIVTGMFVILLLLTPEMMFADINGEISKWKGTARTVGKSIIGLAAIGGAVLTYFKMQTDDGSSGKKALMNYIGALIFGAVAFILIDEFLK
ncbi:MULTISPECIES: DUF4134 domain-containing protein [Chryseobacterium]|uniref:DUF4134 domain-containing protein n=1 Tax=Chryseobacterium muglaense TaxID=2893752 RepID=A0ABR8M8V4_9FLAO|nr:MULTISPECIES: DUF4134 domain-containing protein [Chryseobacterium]MBD3906768.1 DUF4134 domain-containing protein [Chryseobacterium muglaense]